MSVTLAGSLKWTSGPKQTDEELSQLPIVVDCDFKATVRGP